VVQKSYPLQNYKKIVLNCIKVCQEIRFLRQIKQTIKHLYYPSVLNILCVTCFLTSITMP